MKNKRLQSLIDFPLRDLLRGTTSSVIGGVATTTKWLATFVLDTLATIGDNISANGTSPTQARVFDITSGTLIEEVPAGVAISESMRISYDTTEPGVELGSDLVDAQTASTWTANGTNTVEDDGSEVKITYVDTVTGATLTLRDTGALLSDLVIGETYVLTGMARVNSGSVTITGPKGTVAFTTIDTITSTINVPWKSTFVAQSSTGNFTRQNGMGVGEIIWFSEISLKKITPAWKNDTAKDSGIPLHPTKTGDNGEDVFIVYQPWTNGATVAAGGVLTDFDGVQCKYYSSVLGGTTSGTGVADDIGVTDWVEQGNYSNIQQTSSGDGYLPHILSIPTEQTQYLLNSDAPATQTTGSLANGDYVLWQNGAGSSDLTAGTATISTTGSATDGSPLTFSVTSPGTVTVTITGGPPDENQLENGDFPTVFILSAGSTVVKDADDFSSTEIPETGKMRWRLALENLGAQTNFSDGTNTLSYSGTAVEFTDGVTTLSHTVVPIHGDFVGLDEDTGELYYNGSVVDTDGSLAVTWGAITDANNVTDITDNSALDLTDDTWSQP